MNTNCVVPPVPPDAPSGSRPLEDLEIIITQGLSNVAQGLLDRKQTALAMLEIHDRRLYKKSYGTFKLYLLQRWQFSRPRGYQMLHFARMIKMSTGEDTGGPENERRARLMDDAGKARRESDDDPVMRAMKYLVTAYEKIPTSERRNFVLFLQDLLGEMEKKLEPKANAQTGNRF